MNINTNIDILLAKYFSGEASTKELSMLEDWIAESEENQAYFDEMTLAFEKSAQTTPPRAADTAKALSMFEQHLQQSEQPTEQNKSAKNAAKKIAFRRYMQVAAAAIIFVAAASVFFFSQKNEDGKQIYIASTESAIQHTMPDSSNILLSQNSSIRYNQDYSNENKQISLAGKASFDVKNKSGDKLIVSVGETFIKDIGTIFTVDGYEESPYISVSVEDGIVLFYTAGDSGISLYEGETGYFDKATKQFSKQVDGREVGHSQIVFDATPLRKARERLSQQFNVAVMFADSSIGDKQITVSFNANDGIEHILQVIAETLRIAIQYQDGAYILSPL